MNDREGIVIILAAIAVMGVMCAVAFVGFSPLDIFCWLELICPRGDARVVRTWRDSADLGVKRERVTSIYRWPVGTFVIVIGSEGSMGSIEASRVEIPKVTSE